VHEQSLRSREKEYEDQARARERALADGRDHLLSTIRMLEIDRQALRARDQRIADLERQLEDHRQQLSTLVTRTIEKNRAISSTRTPGRPKSKKVIAARLRRAKKKGNRAKASAKGRRRGGR
jgi:hypothetical protein